MDAPAPSPEALRRAQVFWRQAQDDAKQAARQHKWGDFIQSGYLSFQAAINALTAVAYLHGRFQIPSYSAARMAALCEELDARFASVAAACAELEAVQEHSPFQPAAEPAALSGVSAAGLVQARAVLEAVRGYLREHRSRFFKP